MGSYCGLLCLSLQYIRLRPLSLDLSSSLQDIQLRKVLSNDGNRTETEMITTNLWKWFFLQGTFQNHIFVTADRRAGTVRL